MGAECCRLIPENSVSPEEGLVVSRVGEQPNRMVERVDMSRGAEGDRSFAPMGALAAVMHRCTGDPAPAEILKFSLSPYHRANTVAPNCYNRINATQAMDKTCKKSN